MATKKAKPAKTPKKKTKNELEFEQREAERRRVHEEKQEKEDKELLDRFLPNSFLIGLAIKELSEVLSIHIHPKYIRSQYIRLVAQAYYYLGEFLEEMNKQPELTELECDISASLHTYMRKGMDGGLSTIMHGMIRENRGVDVWYAFVKGVHSSGTFNYHDGMTAVDKIDYHSLLDNTIMKACLDEFENDFNSAVNCGYLDFVEEEK